MIQIFLADGTDGRDGPTEGSTRGPRGPKKCSHGIARNHGRTRGDKPWIAEQVTLIFAISCRITVLRRRTN